MDRLGQLCARSRHEIEVHAGDLDNTDTGRYFIDEASELLAGMRMWSQSQYRTDQVVKEILEAGDAVALNGVARQLQDLGTSDGWAASESIALMASRPSGELLVVIRTRSTARHLPAAPNTTASAPPSPCWRRGRATWPDA